MDTLPTEILLHILGYINFNFLRRITTVCKLWRELIYDCPEYKLRIPIYIRPSESPEWLAHIQKLAAQGHTGILAQHIVPRKSTAAWQSIFIGFLRAGRVEKFKDWLMLDLEHQYTSNIKDNYHGFVMNSLIQHNITDQSGLIRECYQIGLPWEEYLLGAAKHSDTKLYYQIRNQHNQRDNFWLYVPFLNKLLAQGPNSYAVLQATLIDGFYHQVQNICELGHIVSDSILSDNTPGLEFIMKFWKSHQLPWEQPQIISILLCCIAQYHLRKYPELTTLKFFINNYIDPIIVKKYLKTMLEYSTSYGVWNMFKFYADRLNPEDVDWISLKTRYKSILDNSTEGTKITRYCQMYGACQLLTASERAPSPAF